MSALIRQVALVSTADAIPAATVMQISAALQKQATREPSLKCNGGPGVSRTRDLRFRKPLLYPSELRGHLWHG